MGLIDKMKFWKKEPDFDLDSSLDLGSNPMSPDPMGGSQSSFDSSLGMDPNTGFGQAQEQMNNTINSNPIPTQNNNPMGMQEQPRIITPQAQETQSGLRQESTDKNLELISMKLDNLKIAIENINQRLMNIEKIAKDSQNQEVKRRPNW
jgi:hypothetical protein